MRRYSREAEETVQAQDLIWEWMRSGLLEKEQIPRLSEDLQTDLRRTNNFLRLVLFLFTAIIIGASLLLLIEVLHITEDRARAMACAVAAEHRFYSGDGPRDRRSWRTSSVFPVRIPLRGSHRGRVCGHGSLCSSPSGRRASFAGGRYTPHNIRSGSRQRSVPGHSICGLVRRAEFAHLARRSH